MRCDLGVPNLTIWYTLSRRGAQCAPEQRKIERFVGEQCSPLRLCVCMWVAYGDHQSRKKQPPAKSRLPQEDAARKEDENGHARNPVQQACKPPVREVPERHAAVERGDGQQVEQPEQGTRAGKPVRAERVRAKLAAGPARQMAARENGDGGRLHRRTAPQAVRHRACTVPPDSRMTKRCPHSCTAATSRKMGSTPLSSAHQSAAMSTRKPSRT